MRFVIEVNILGFYFFITTFFIGYLQVILTDEYLGNNNHTEKIGKIVLLEFEGTKKHKKIFIVTDVLLINEQTLLRYVSRQNTILDITASYLGEKKTLQH